MPHSHMEAMEMQEQLEKALERAEKAGEKHSFPSWTKELSLATAVIAVLTAMASLGTGHLSNYALMEKNEAAQLQAKASDQWAYYQAKGLKALIFATRADIVAGRSPVLAQTYLAEMRHYQEDQEKIKSVADGIEKQIEEHNAAAERCMRYHHPFAIAVALFQVAIALAAMAVLTWRKSLWWVGLTISAVAFAFTVKGSMFFF